jgi:hypothetical protein
MYNKARLKILFGVTKKEFRKLNLQPDEDLHPFTFHQLF